MAEEQKAKYEIIYDMGTELYIAKVFGSAAIPVESAEVIKKALKKAEKDGTITSKNKWQMIEYWAADYLAGK